MSSRAWHLAHSHHAQCDANVAVQPGKRSMVRTATVWHGMAQHSCVPWRMPSGTHSAQASIREAQVILTSRVVLTSRLVCFRNFFLRSVRHSAASSYCKLHSSFLWPIACGLCPMPYARGPVAYGMTWPIICSMVTKARRYRPSFFCYVVISS